jgi:hypothetical protein
MLVKMAVVAGMAVSEAAVRMRLMGGPRRVPRMMPPVREVAAAVVPGTVS